MVECKVTVDRVSWAALGVRIRNSLPRLLGLLAAAILTTGCTGPIIVLGPVTPTSTAPACLVLQVPGFLVKTPERMDGIVFPVGQPASLASEPGLVQPEVHFLPVDCQSGSSQLTYRWFEDGKPMREWDDFRTVPLRAQDWPNGQIELRAVVAASGLIAEGSIKISKQ
jgi:hypothetical protein